MSQIDPQLLLSLMDTVPDRIYFKDRQGHFLSVNRAMREYLHAPDEASFQGRTDFDFFLLEHAEEAMADEQYILATGESIVGKIERENLPDGRFSWVSTTKVPMRDGAGNIIGTCGISRDITAEHERAEKLSEYTQALAEKQSQMQEELALATQVQQALLPQSYPSFPRGTPEDASALRFSHRYLPEALVGGDFFAVVPVSDTQAGVLICDVMGHGVHAALVTAVQRVLVEELQGLAGDPGAFLGELNRRLHHFFEPLLSSMFATALYLVVDTVTGTVRFANAGHPHPLHISRARNEVRTLGSYLLNRPFALGVSDESVYVTEEDMVQSGDLILLFTDGLCDLGEGKDLTPEDPRFLGLVQNCIHQHGEAFLDALLAESRLFSGQDHFLDDVCLIGVEVEYLQGRS